MSDTPKTIECEQHGRQAGTFVCRHLAKGQGLGFHYGLDPDDPDALFPNAWCDECEATRAREGGWDEESEKQAEITLLCSNCYQRARLLNWPRETHTAFQQLLETAIAYLQDRQDVLRDRYRLNDHERYDWDQDAGQLIFSSKGTPVVIADIQFVGSISTHSDTWMWSWANESFVESAKARIREVRAHGDSHRMLRLASAFWHGDEQDGWGMTAISALLLGAKGGYRTPDEGGFTYMIMTDIRWAQ